MAIRPKKYLCTFEGCDKAYNRPALLRQHERTHTNERPFECPVKGCDKSFFRKLHLQVHRHSHQENDEKPFQCRICGKGAISPQLLKRHELTHTKKYKCTFEDCTKAFYHYQSLKHHIDIDHKQILTCDVCNRRFQRPVLLDEHKQKHHGGPPVEVLQCDFPGCFLTFKTKKLVQIHKKKEHPQFSCLECGEQCTGEESLRVHMLAHENTAGQFQTCSLCEATFVTRAELAKHYHDIHDENHADSADSADISVGTAASASLQTLMREPGFEAEVSKEDMQVPARGRPKLANHNEEVSLESVGSIIDLVLGSVTKSYECPKKNCTRKFVRHHAYLKHLEWHKRQVEKAEQFLQKLKEEELKEEEAKKAEERNESDHFTDISDDDDELDVESADATESEAERNGKDHNSEKSDALESSDSDELEDTSKSPTQPEVPAEFQDEFAQKQMELDALLASELENLDD